MLLGGHLDYPHNQTVAALVYRRNEHAISIFIRETTEDRRGYTVINREANGLHHCIVSDLNAKELNEFANLVGE
jgi:anti-sigma factor RsiW